MSMTLIEERPAVGQGMTPIEAPAVGQGMTLIEAPAPWTPSEPELDLEMGPGLPGPVPVVGVTQNVPGVAEAAMPGAPETEGVRAYKGELGKALQDLQKQPTYFKLMTGQDLDTQDQGFLGKAAKSFLATGYMNLPAAGMSYYGRRKHDSNLSRADAMTPEERTRSARQVARAYEVALAMEPSKAKGFTDHLANIMGGVAGFVLPTPGRGLTGVGARAVKRFLPQAGRTALQKIGRGAAIGAGAGAVYGAADLPTVAPTDTAGDIALKKATQFLATEVGFTAFGAGSAAAAHVLPKAFYRQYDWTPERFQKEFPALIRRVAANKGTVSEMRLVQDVNAYLGVLGQKPGPYARGRVGLDVQIAERRAWVDMIPVLRDILSGVRQVKLKGRGIYDPARQRGMEGVEQEGAEPGGPVPGQGPGGAPVEAGRILQAPGATPRVAGRARGAPAGAVTPPAAPTVAPAVAPAAAPAGVVPPPPVAVVPELMTPEEYKAAGLGPANDVEVLKAFRVQGPVSAIAVDTYGLKPSMPKGYVREGDRYVFKPEPPAKPTAPARMGPAAEPAATAIPAAAPAARAPVPGMAEIRPIKEGKAFPKAQPLVKIMGKAIPRRTTLPVLSTIHVQDGIATATDLDTQVRMKSVLKDGLYEKMGDEFIRSNIEATDFPPDAVLTGKRDLIRFPDGPVLLDRLKKVGLAMSEDVTRQVLNGTLLEVGEGGVWLVATDGRRLTRDFVPADTGKLKPGTSFILREGFMDMLQADKKAPAWQMNVPTEIGAEGAVMVQIENGNMEVTGKVIEGTYPSFRQVIPAQKDVSWTVDKEKVLSALKQLKPFLAKQKNPQIKLWVENGKLYIRNTTDEKEYQRTIEVPVEVGGLMKTADTMTVQMPLRAEGGPAPEVKKGEKQVAKVIPSLGLNPDFLADALNAVGEGRVKLGVAAGDDLEMEPMIIQGASAPPAAPYVAPVVEKPAKKGKRAGKAMAAPEEEFIGALERVAGAEAAVPGVPGAREEPVRPGLTAIAEEYGKAAPAPADDPEYSIFPLESPEMVQLGKQLTGKYPVVKRGIRAGVAGLFEPGQISIKASLYDSVTKFEKATIGQELSAKAMEEGLSLSDPDTKAAVTEAYEARINALREERKGQPSVWALKTLAHEIGHAADWEPLEKVKGRGNIFAHIGSLSGYIKKSFPMGPGDDVGLTKEARQAIRAETEKEVRALYKKDADPKVVAAKRKEIYAAKIAEAMKSEDLASYGELMAELKPMIAWWHGTKTIPLYYDSDPSEMYAETLSVLLNNPAAVQKRAPAFYKMFYAYMERKPELKAAYERVMKLIKTSELYPERDRIMTEEMNQAEKDLQAWANQQKVRTWRERFDLARRQLDRELGPIQQRIVKVPDEEMMGKALGGMDRFLYRTTMQEGALVRMQNDVLRPLMEAGLEMMDLDKYLFHKRVVEDQPTAGVVAQPWGFDRISSGEMLAEMQRRLGPNFTTLEDLQGQFRAIYKEEALDRIRRYRIFGEEMMEELDAREAYATWHVTKGAPPEDPFKAMFETRFGKGITSHIYKQYGTHMPVKSPFTSTVQKMISLISMAERENMKYSVLTALTAPGSPFKDEWEPAERFWNGKFREIRYKENERIGTLTVLRDGKLEGFYGPRVLVDAMSFGRPEEMNMIAQAAFVTLNIEKGLLTRANPTFWPRAFWRDIRQFNRYMPGVATDWRTWVPLFGGAYSRFAWPAFKAAKSIYKGRPDAIGQEALRRGVPISSRQGYFGEAPISGGLEREVKTFGLPAIKDPETIKEHLKALWNKFLSVGQILEATSKINGMLYLDKRHPNVPEWKKIIAVHTWSGSPDFLNKAAANRWLDWIRIFYNPWKEGWRSESRSWWGGGGWESRKWEVLLATIRRTIIPRIALTMLLGGGLHRLLKRRQEDMPDISQQYQDGPSEFERRHNHIVPLGWYDKEQRKVLYLKLPLGESERNISAVFDTVLRAAIGTLGEEDLGGQRWSEIFQYMAGDLPGVNPITAMVGNWLLYISGGTPYDAYRMRPALTRAQATVGGAEGMKAMLTFTYNQMFGSLTGQIQPETLDRLPLTITERLINKTPILRSLVRISSSGYQERLRNATLSVEEKQEGIKFQLEDAVLRLRDGGRLTQDEVTRLSQGYYLDEQFKSVTTPLPAELELERYYYTHFMYLMERSGIPFLPPGARAYKRQPTKARKAAVLQELMK